MVLNTTINNSSAISWRSVLLVGETGENHRSAVSHSQTLSHNIVSSTPRMHGVRIHYRIHLRNKRTVFEELEVSIVDLTVANAVLLET